MKKLELFLPASVPCPQRVQLSSGPCRHYETEQGTMEVFALDRMARAKRFTPAELAAEDWRRKWTELRVTISHGEMSTRQAEINATMRRFIELPNYDEVAS